jgi:hypothetical protein
MRDHRRSQRRERGRTSLTRSQVSRMLLPQEVTTRSHWILPLVSSEYRSPRSGRAVRHKLQQRPRALSVPRKSRRPPLRTLRSQQLSFVFSTLQWNETVIIGRPAGTSEGIVVCIRRAGAAHTGTLHAVSAGRRTGAYPPRKPNQRIMPVPSKIISAHSDDAIRTGQGWRRPVRIAELLGLTVHLSGAPSEFAPRCSSWHYRPRTCRKCSGADDQHLVQTHFIC